MKGTQYDQTALIQLSRQHEKTFQVSEFYIFPEKNVLKQKIVQDEHLLALKIHYVPPPLLHPTVLQRGFQEEGCR